MEEIDYYKLWEHSIPTIILSNKEIQKLAEVMKDLPTGAYVHIRHSGGSGIGINYYAYRTDNGQCFDITDYESW